jgi:cleavage stimulation factor subunit 1
LEHSTLFVSISYTWIFIHLLFLFFAVRLYDVKTFQCFVSNNPSDQHKAALTSVSRDVHYLFSCASSYFFLTQVNYSPNGNLYVSASKDGDIKIWDGVSNRCVNTFLKAHDGAEVCSATFSRNAKVSL